MKLLMYKFSPLQIWLFLTALSGALFYYVVVSAPQQYTAYEPHFINPITSAPKESIQFRNDDMGDGHFWAKRSRGRKHKGVDILAPLYEPIVATQSGRVSFVGEKGGYGNFIKINHPSKFNSRYAHLEHVFVSVGQWVEQGDMIGTIGKSGNADHPDILPHLHFEIRKHDQAYNPQLFLEKISKNR